MGFLANLFKKQQPGPTESFKELMQKYRQAYNGPREQRFILAKAAAVIKEEDLRQMVELNATLNEWEQKHGK